MLDELVTASASDSVPDSLGTAFDRTKFLKERRVMMQLWADYLDKFKIGGKIVAIRKGKKA